MNWLLSFGNESSLLIHLRTDQVYEGVKSSYKGEDEAKPVNIYGKSKVAYYDDFLPADDLIEDYLTAEPRKGCFGERPSLFRLAISLKSCSRPI